MKTGQSKIIHYTKRRVTKIRAKLYWTGGNLSLYASVNGNMDGPGDWEEITGLVSGAWTEHTFTKNGGHLYIRVEKEDTTILHEYQDISGQALAPAVSIEITEGSEAA